IGTPQFRRLIHSAVDPDSVSDAIALTLRWNAVKRAAIAMDWSTRVNRRLRKSWSRLTGCECSASTQMRCIASIVSTGYFPLADSAESITASVPSSTALATSETSARVGIGLEIIDSIIWVAVIVSLLFSRAMRIIRFCSAGTEASPTSTARSPRATMMPSQARMMSSSAGIASARSILAIRRALPPAAHEFPSHVHVGARLGKRDGQVVGVELCRGLDVLHVLCRERRRGQSATLPVDALVIGEHAAMAHRGVHFGSTHGGHVQHDLAVVQQKHGAGRHVARQFLVVQP